MRAPIVTAVVALALLGGLPRAQQPQGGPPPQWDMASWQLVPLWRGDNRETIAGDPAIRAGRLAVEVYRWRVPAGTLPRTEAPPNPEQE